MSPVFVVGRFAEILALLCAYKEVLRRYHFLPIPDSHALVQIFIMAVSVHRFLSLPLLCLAFFTSAASAWSRKVCQDPTTRNPLSGCPKGTLLVGAVSNFTSIQSAVLSLPNNTKPYVILIEAGNYTEQVNVTRPGPVTLLGQTSHPNNNTLNAVNVIWHDATGNNKSTYDNLYTSTLMVAPTLNSSATGLGPDGNNVPADTPFGNTNFRAYNLNFVNDYLPYSAGPSLAISISYANAGFYYCGFYSYQDTVYVGKLGNVYTYESTIAGQTDVSTPNVQCRQPCRLPPVIDTDSPLVHVRLRDHACGEMRGLTSRMWWRNHGVESRHKTG